MNTETQPTTAAELLAEINCYGCHNCGVDFVHVDSPANGAGVEEDKCPNCSNGQCSNPPSYAICHNKSKLQ